MRKHVFGLRVYADSKGPDQPAHPLTESLDTTEYMNGEQRPRFVHVQDDLILRILRNVRRHNFA